MKNWVGVQSEPFPSSLAGFLKSSAISTLSSVGNILGTSPVFKILFTSSKKLSCFICVSVNKNEVGLPFLPTYFIIVLMSSRHSCIR